MHIEQNEWGEVRSYLKKKVKQVDNRKFMTCKMEKVGGEEDYNISNTNH